MQGNFNINSNPGASNVYRASNQKNKIIKSSDGYKGANYLTNSQGQFVGFEIDGERVLLANTSLVKDNTRKKLSQSPHNYTKEEVNDLINSYIEHPKDNMVFKDHPDYLPRSFNSRNLVNKTHDDKDAPINIGVSRTYKKQPVEKTEQATEKEKLMQGISTDIYTLSNDIDVKIEYLISTKKELELQPESKRKDAVLNLIDKSIDDLMKKSGDLQKLKNKSRQIVKNKTSDGEINTSINDIKSLNDSLSKLKTNLERLMNINISVHVEPKEPELDSESYSKEEYRGAKYLKNKEGNIIGFKYQGEEVHIAGSHLVDEHNEHEIQIDKRESSRKLINSLIDDHIAKLESSLDHLNIQGKTKVGVAEKFNYDDYPDTKMDNDGNLVKVYNTFEPLNPSKKHYALDKLLQIRKQVFAFINKFDSYIDHISEQEQSEKNTEIIDRLESHIENLSNEIPGLKKLYDDVSIMFSLAEIHNKHLKKDTMKSLEDKIKFFDGLLNWMKDIDNDIHNRYPDLLPEEIKKPTHFTAEDMRGILVTAKEMDFRINDLKEKYNTYANFINQKSTNPTASKNFLKKLQSFNSTLEEQSQNLKNIVEQAKRVVKNKTNVLVPEYNETKSAIDSIDQILKRLESGDEDLTSFMNYISLN